MTSLPSHLGRSASYRAKRLQRHFVNNEKLICCIYDKYVDLIECNISRNNRTT